MGTASGDRINSCRRNLGFLGIGPVNSSHVSWIRAWYPPVVQLATMTRSYFMAPGISVPFGVYSRIRPLALWFVPRLHGNAGERNRPGRRTWRSPGSKPGHPSDRRRRWPTEGDRNRRGLDSFASAAPQRQPQETGPLCRPSGVRVVVVWRLVQQTDATDRCNSGRR